MLTKIPRVLDLSKQVLSTNRGMANTRMMMPSGRAKKLAETVLGKNAISPSLAKASVAAGVTFGAGLPLALTDPKNVGASFAKAKVSLQDAFKKITDSVEDAASIPQSYFMQVQQAYDEEIQRQQELQNIQEFGNPMGAPEEMLESGEIKPVSLLFAQGGPLDMQETPMAPNLSEQMPAQTEEVTQAEMQEAQGALQQILQVIDMLIQQGLSAEEIAQFLEQYGISEDELEQAAQILGVDINQLLGGQMQQPQEPMMMAGGGGTDFDEAGNPIVVTSPSTQVDTFMGPLEETGIRFDTNMPTLQDTGMRVDASEIPAPSVTINVDYLNFMQPNGVLDERSYGNAIERAREMEQSVQELLINHEKAIKVANPQDKEMLIKNLSEYVNMVKKNENATIFSPSLPIEKKN